MLHQLKRRFYFVVAAYFGFWAKLVLRRWKPRIIVITGSSGKTTVLHMVEAQLGDQAIYGHHANSAIGIPFHILGFNPNVSSKVDYILRLILAPIKAWHKAPPTKLYVVEADCDRPREGKFLSKLLKPEAVLWISVSRTHSMNFDSLVQSGQFIDHVAAIAHEFGFFIAAATNLVLLNGDQPAMMSEAKRIQAGVTMRSYSLKQISEYQIEPTSTRYVVDGQILNVPGLHPKEAGVSVQMVRDLVANLQLPFDSSFMKFTMPPGRANVLQGKNSSVLIDSTYNTGLGATEAVLRLFEAYPANNKWLVLGDLLEQGSIEQEEHEQLGQLIATSKVQQVILLGKRNKKFTFPILQAQSKLPVQAFEDAKEVLDYLQANLKGGEAILFKGAQGLEGVVEQFLANPDDADKLVRRGAAWTKRRQAWGLPR
jgi:UDP-N-acetylmuramoyl-tripeptide--D-alanyl-D-alanine ligase